MLRKIVAVWIVALVSLSLAGCGSNEPSAPAEQTKTAAEYKAEADKEITSENVEAELDKLEQEVDQEAGQEP
ncbi:MAG TPA: hypothetical protein PLU87_17190 [Sedimentisphaerales bacterium]|nr:hypothetical protein [Sedimentisphaerales bacterium]HRS12694.1 hypothetical protein [Sedimentisphaerales bacterium]HRV49324.1 hypothetical protein [Sedimentisphaerales bacterium]